MGHTENISPAVLLLLRHVAVARPRREHRFPVTPLMRVINVLLLLPSNGRCISTYFAVVA
jgi:hypothetical protein